MVRRTANPSQNKTKQSRGIINTFGVYQTYYETNLLHNHSPSSISWIGSIQPFLLLIVGVISGPLYDMGFFRSLVAVGTVLIVLSFMLTSLCKAYWQVILAQSIFVGVGAGCLFIPAVAVVPRYFLRRRAVATGIVTSGSSLGGTLYPIIFQQLEPRIGFPWTNRVLGFIALATCTFSLVVIRPLGKPSERRSLLELPAFRERTYQIYCVAMFFGYIAFFGPVFYLQSYALTQGLSDGTLALYLVAILNAASTAGRIVPPYFAPKIGAINIMFFSCASAGVITMCWIAVRSAAGNVAFAVAYGFSSGGIIAMPTVVLASLMQDIGLLGTRMGMSSVLNAFASLCGAPIVGAILKGSAGDYLGVQLFCGLSMLVTAGIWFALRWTQSGPRLLVNV